MNVSGTLHLSSIWIMQSHTTQNFRKGKMNELHIERLPHPDYSPDISSNDFFFYGYTKNNLKGRSLSSRDALVDFVIEIFNIFY